MKNLKIYGITKEQFENTEYTPLGVTIDDSIETEDNWDYGDVIENMGNGFIAECVHENDSLKVWKITNEDEEVENYEVELLK